MDFSNQGKRQADHLVCRQMLIDGTGRQIGDEKGTEGTGGKDNSFA